MARPTPDKNTFRGQARAGRALPAPIAVEVGPDGVFVDDAGSGVPTGKRAVVVDRFYRSPEHRSEPGSGQGCQSSQASSNSTTA